MIVYSLLNSVRALLGFSAIILLLRFVFGYEFRKNKTPFIISSSLITACLLILEFLADSPENAFYIADDVFTPSALFISYFAFKPQKKRTFFMFSLAFYGVSEYLWFLLFSVLRSVWVGASEHSLLSLVIYCILYSSLAAVSIIAAAFKKSKAQSLLLEKINPLIYICLFLVQFSAYYELESSVADTPNYPVISAVLKLLSVGIAVGSIVYVVSLYIKISAKQLESEKLLQSELRRYEETVKKNQEIRKFRHDCINNLVSVSALLDKGELAQAGEYIKELTNRLESTKISYNTGNYLADAVISDKAAAAEESGVKIEFYGQFPAQGIDNIDICTVLSNLLDNAVAACRPLAPCSVKVKSQIKKDGVIITISNPVKEKAEIKNNTVKTTKNDKENHGLGIGNVKAVAKKYDGNVILSCEDKQFTAQVLLLFNKI